MLIRTEVAGLTLLTLLALPGCTSIPRSETHEARFSALACNDLDAEIAKARETQRVATAARSDSWHVVFPVLVVARYASAQSALSEAEGRLAKLENERGQKRCASSGPQATTAKS